MKESSDILWSLAIAMLLISCRTGDYLSHASEPAVTGSSVTTSSSRGTTLRASDRVFEQIAPFVKMAPSHGDRARGEHGTFAIMAAGQSSPPHTHSSAYQAVVVSGTIVNPFGAETDSAKLGPGSAWSVPAGASHVTACVGDVPCEFYFHSKGSFDFSPLKTQRGARPAAARALPHTTLKWDDVSSFSKMSTVFGDRDHSAHGTIGIFKAKTAAPSHTHSNPYRGVVLRGTMNNPFEGDKDPPQLSPGSSWFVPAGVPHRTACISEEPCLFYFFSDFKRDFVPVAPT